MKSFNAILVACCLIIGCTKKDILLQTAIPIMPNSTFVKHGYLCLKDSTINRATGKPFTQDELIQWLVLQGLSNKEAVKEYNDPFFVKSLEYLTFESNETGGKIAGYYENMFSKKNWTKKRGINNLEYTNGGGDWLTVYTNNQCKGDVLVHIIGSWEDKDILHADNTSRQIIFRFYNCSANTVLTSFKHHE